MRVLDFRPAYHPTLSFSTVLYCLLFGSGQNPKALYIAQHNDSTRRGRGSKINRGKTTVMAITRFHAQR